MRRWVSGGGCRLGWLSLCPEQEGDFGLRWCLGSGLEDPSDSRGFCVWSWESPVHDVLALGPPRWAPCGDLCLLLGLPVGQAGGAGVLCVGLSPGSAAGPRRVSVPQAAGPCSQPCPEDGSIGWAGDRGALGRWSPVPWGQGGRQPGLLCQPSTGDPLGTPSPRCRVLPFPSPSWPPLTAACPLQGDHQWGHGDRQGQQ